jgi:hypothetical protein
MHIFKAKILLYLSFNAIGLLFMLISMMGIPGDLDPEKPSVKPLMKMMDFLLPLALRGIPVLLLVSIAAFYFQFPFVGKLCSILSLSIGLGLFLTLVGIYRVK